MLSRRKGNAAQSHQYCLERQDVLITGWCFKQNRSRSHQCNNGISDVGWGDEIGPRPCHFFKWAWSIFKLRQSTAESLGNTICLYLSAFKTNKNKVEIGLYNLPLSFPACACHDLEMHMLDTRTTSVDSLRVTAHLRDPAKHRL